MGRIEEDPDTEVEEEDGDLMQGDLEEDEDPTMSHLFDDILQPPVNFVQQHPLPAAIQPVSLQSVQLPMPAAFQQQLPASVQLSQDLAQSTTPTLTRRNCI